MVELNDPVDGRLEDQPKVLLGLADRFVRLSHVFERRSASDSARSLSSSACRASAWACVLRIWFARMRAATPSPSTAMIAVDCTAESNTELNE